MATIYDTTGETIAYVRGVDMGGIGIQAAYEIAEMDGAPVILEDDDGDWMVHPSGDVEEFEWPDPVA